MPVQATAKGQVGAVPKVINYVKSLGRVDGRAGVEREAGWGGSCVHHYRVSRCQLETLNGRLTHNERGSGGAREVREEG